MPDKIDMMINNANRYVTNSRDLNVLNIVYLPLKWYP